MGISWGKYTFSTAIGFGWDLSEFCVVHVELGTNDLCGSRSAEAVVQDLLELVQEALHFHSSIQNHHHRSVYTFGNSANKLRHPMLIDGRVAQLIGQSVEGHRDSECPTAVRAEPMLRNHQPVTSG